MAKWGEGDPRWIVEERPDATNVNNWHWTEKNATAWSKEKLKELLIGQEIKDESVGSVKLTEFEKLDGEASANNRKAKLIFFYEWDLKIKWSGKRYDKDSEASGDISVPNLSDENSAEDLDISVHGSDSKLKAMVRERGVELVRKQLAKYMQDLKAEFAKDMILPTKNEANSKPTQKPDAGKITDKSVDGRKAAPIQPMERLELGGLKFNTGEIRDTVAFMCTASDIYRTLTQRELLQAFTNGEVLADARPGGKFRLFGGEVEGTFEALEENKRIKQKWRFKGWPDGHFSDVTLEINQKEENTEVALTQTGVPITDMERTKEGWNRYYWTAIKRTFGFGSFLM